MSSHDLQRHIEAGEREVERQTERFLLRHDHGAALRAAEERARLNRLRVTAMLVCQYAAEETR